MSEPLRYIIQGEAMHVNPDTTVGNTVFESIFQFAIYTLTLTSALAFNQFAVMIIDTVFGNHPLAHLGWMSISLTLAIMVFYAYFIIREKLDKKKKSKQKQTRTPP
jgi:hypothetical protein